jgi:hypothetical protein
MSGRSFGRTIVNNGGCKSASLPAILKDKRSLLNSEYKAIISTYPDASSSMQRLLKVLRDIEHLVSYTPASVGESKKWAEIISSAEENQKNCCEALRGKTLFSTLYGTYTVMLNKLNSVLKASTQAGQTNQGDGFKEVHNRKQHNTEETAHTSKNAALPRTSVEVTTRNFFGGARGAGGGVSPLPPEDGNRGSF